LIATLPDAQQARDGTHRRYSDSYKRLVTLLLMLAYTFNAADRNLIAIVAQSMKLDLRLSDTQLGLLGGTAFASLYAVSGIPIARLAERLSRVSIIALSLAVWSMLTSLCAAAGSFAQLVTLRVGVGIAEAGCSAPAHSLISDYYRRAERTGALSLYSCGLSLGYLLVSVVGGYVVLHQGWRAACLAVGLPGVAVALLIRALIEEPERGLADGRNAAGALATPAGFSARTEARELATVARALFLSWPAANVIAGFTLSSFASYGAWMFIPAYFNRRFGLDFATVGLVLGLAGSVPVALGTLLGGMVTDRAAAHGERWYALVPAIGLAIATPLYLLALVASGWQAAAALLAAAGFFQYASLGPSFGVVQNVVGARRRATATALLYLCLTVALAAGPLFTGGMIDHLFAAACPGSGAGRCGAALAQASRAGIVAALCFHAWAAVHYLLGAFGLGRQIQAAGDPERPEARARAARAQVSSR